MKYNWTVFQQDNLILFYRFIILWMQGSLINVLEDVKH